MRGSVPLPDTRYPRPDLLYLASIDFPLVKARAIQIVHTCHALARAGCRVRLVVGRREGGPLAEQLARYGLAPHPNLHLVRVPAFRLPASAPAPLQGLYTRLWNWSYVAACLMLLPRLLGERPAFLLARDYRLAWLLLKLHRWHGRRLVFEVHGLPSAELLDGARLTPAVRREAARRRALEQLVFDGAWRLLTITDCLRDRLRHDYGVSPERVFTVPDAAGVTDDGPRTTDEGGENRGRAPTGGALTPALSQGEREPGGLARLIYVGQLYPWKGVDLVVRALAVVPRAELTIIGGLPDDPQRARLERLAAELGLRERVHFSGPQPYQQVPGLLAQADVALLPLAEGLVARCFTSPLKLFDYLAAGLPIVAVDFPTVGEILRDEGNALLVPPDDPAAMAAAVNRLLDDPQLAARLAHQARQTAADYTWDRRAERVLAALGAPLARAVREPAR